jgi:hypothetical protein
MAIQIRKAERTQAKLRVGLFGPSGSGKSMSALRMAHGLCGDWNKVCVIDTENNSAHLYSHLGPYSVIGLKAPYTPEAYIEAIKAAEEAAFEVIIIDSITHEWAGEGGILEMADALGKDAKSSFTVWAKLTPRHNKFIETILRSSTHMICCGRSKQDYAINQTEKHGKTVNVPEKIGLKAVTREGFDYEMTVAFDLMISHYAVSTKDRTSIFQDHPEHIITEETGKRLRDWNDGGKPDPLVLKKHIMVQLRRLEIELPPTSSEVAGYLRAIMPTLTGYDLTDDNLGNILDALRSLTPETAHAALRPKPVTPPVAAQEDRSEALPAQSDDAPLPSPDDAPDPVYEPDTASLNPEDIPF